MDFDANISDIEDANEYAAAIVRAVHYAPQDQAEATISRLPPRALEETPTFRGVSTSQLAKRVRMIS